MKRLSITIVILFTVFTMACKKSSDISTSGGPRTNSGTTQSAPARSQSSETAPVFEENIPEAMPPYAAPQPIAAAGLNPPHGQPNHRCDIAVGVPDHTVYPYPELPVYPVATPLIRLPHRPPFVPVIVVPRLANAKLACAAGPDP